MHPAARAGSSNDAFAIDLRNITKVYKGKILALGGIDMRVRRGEIFGLLGPNGAGKSTLVKIMMTVVRATRAEGTLLGNPVGHKPTLAKVGYLPENHRFPRYLTGRQCVEFFGALAKMDRRTRKRRSAELIETVGMSDSADRRIATYSKGMAQRIGLAQALVNDPELVLLDEPTDGVDPRGRRDIRDVMTRMREQGRTVFINSHLLSELEVVSDRVAILVGGSVARQGTINELTAAKQRYEIEILPGDRFEPSSIAASMPNVFRAGAADSMQPLRGKLASGEWAELHGSVVSIGTTEAARIQSVLDGMRAAGLVIRRVQPMRPSLEDLFMEAVNANNATIQRGGA